MVVLVHVAADTFSCNRLSIKAKYNTEKVLTYEISSIHFNIQVQGEKQCLFKVNLQ